MYPVSTTNLTNALQSIAQLNNSERDLLKAVLGAANQPIIKNQKKSTTTNNGITVQSYMDSIIKKHNSTGYKKNRKRLNISKNTQKIGSYFHKATATNLS